MMNFHRYLTLRNLLPVGMGLLTLFGTLVRYQIFLSHDELKINQASFAEAVSLQKQITLDLESRIGSL